jgi:hypothetical protein
MTADEPHPGTRPRSTGTRVPLVCPECGDPARAVPPQEWPLAGWAPRPRFSHHDGTPLCPVVGPDGYTPAEPSGAAMSGAAPAATRPTDNTTTGRATATGTSTGGIPATGADTTRYDDGDGCRTRGARLG